MRYLSLPAWRDGRPLYLAELILSLGWYAADLTWKCQELEIGPGSEITALQEAAASDERLTSLELLHLATPYVQITEGEVIGYKGKSEAALPLVTFRAVDSTSWDLEIYTQSGFQCIVTAFPEAVELDPKLFET